MTFVPGQKLTAAALNAAFAEKANKNNPVFTGTVPIDKTTLGLENVNNTSDADKPISTAVRSELNVLRSLIGDGDTTIPLPADTTAPIITTPADHTVAENAGFSIALTANELATWSKVGGADAALFTLSGSTLTMAAKDYETPIDNGSNNVYEVQIRATDAAGNFSLKTISVTISNVVEGGAPPSITSSAAPVVATTSPYSLELTANEAVTWSIVGGLDAALFDLNTSTTGANAFNPSLPTDNGSNNVYELTVRATSIATGLTTDQNIAITINPPFTNPASLSGLVRWFDASDSISFNTWTDKSSLAGHATKQQTLASTTYVAAEKNGLGVVRFAAGGLYSSPDFDLGLPTIFIVAKPTSLTGARHLLRKWQADNNELIFRLTSGAMTVNTGYKNQAAVQQTITGPTAIIDTWAIYETRFDGTVIANSINGGTETTAALAGTSALVSTEALMIGGNGSSDTWIGDIAEIIIYNRALSSPEATSVRSYLTTKWGL